MKYPSRWAARLKEARLQQDDRTRQTIERVADRDTDVEEFTRAARDESSVFLFIARAAIQKAHTLAQADPKVSGVRRRELRRLRDAAPDPPCETQREQALDGVLVALAELERDAREARAHIRNGGPHE